MFRSSFRSLFLIPAEVVVSDPEAVCEGEGVYYVFFRGGIELLKAISFFDYSSQQPFTHGDSAHLYTAFSLRMRTRVMCHLRGSSKQSELRKTLAAIQLAKRAISRTETANCTVTDRQSLNAWMLANAQFAFVECNDAAHHAKQLLRRAISPLNIQHQRVPKFADQLLDWRRRYYPRDGNF